MAISSIVKSRAVLAALVLGMLLPGAAAHALDCWVPTRDTTQPRYRSAAPGMREATMVAVDMVRDNPHFKAMPRPIRIRATIAVSPGHGQVNVKAYQPAVWEGKCGLVDGADRCCSDGGVNVMFNDRALHRIYGRDEEIEVYYEPIRTGTLAGFPLYDELYLLMTLDGRVPWKKVTVAEMLDLAERQERKRLAEAEAKRDEIADLDQAKQIEDVYQSLKKVDAQAAEQLRAEMLAQLKTEKAHKNVAVADLDANKGLMLAEIQRVRASLTPAQLAAQAYHGNGPLSLGRADDPLSKPLAKPDPDFFDKTDPNRVQLIRVFISVVENDPVIERRETMRRTRETLDYARLARLMR